MRTITQQIADAKERSGLSVAELLKKSGLRMKRSALQRKLTGARPLPVNEAETLARVLGITLAFDPGKKRVAGC